VCGAYFCRFGNQKVQKETLPAPFARESETAARLLRTSWELGIGNSWVQPRLEHIVRAPSHSTLWGWLAQKCLESSLGEMPVVSKRSRESILFHDQETGSVCEAPALVSHILIPLQCVFKKLACLRDDDDLGRVSKRHDRPCRRLAKTPAHSH
jgi:hypothetical protein